MRTAPAYIKNVAEEGGPVMTITPVDETGKINGLPELLAPGHCTIRTAHQHQSYVIGFHTVDRVELTKS